MSRLFGPDFITQKYLRRFPASRRAKAWAGTMVHIQTENGVWRTGGQGYTLAGNPDAWVLPFEEAVKNIDHCGPEKQGCFLRVVSPQKSNTPSSYPTWIITETPANAPRRNGPFYGSKFVEEFLREAYRITPDITCIVVDIDSDDNTWWPEHGYEWLDVYGDRRRRHPRRDNKKAQVKRSASPLTPVAEVLDRPGGFVISIFPEAFHKIHIGDKLFTAPPARCIAMKALADAYKHGFEASSQGYNGEIFPEYETNNEWLAQRDSDLSALSAQEQDAAGAVIRLGIYGRAFDRPEERRAYTYEHQPGNVEAYKLGRACSEIHSGGDWIDRGLNLLNALQREGFGVYELPAASAKQEGSGDA